MSAEQILARLSALEERLSRIESALSGLTGADQLRSELETKRDEMDALARQSLHVVELLDAARKEIESLKRGGGA